MRSVCVAALLGNCGLLVPASAARIPGHDGFFLRAASFDAPSEGLSAFAVEMLDVSTILRDATDTTLVLVDELGRGTETRAGAAIAGAVLEALMRRGCRGIFTTHLHEMFDLPLHLPAVEYLRMEIAVKEGGAGGIGGWVPTWRLARGRCVDSLAVHAAQVCGLPAEVIQRAHSLAALSQAPRAPVLDPPTSAAAGAGTAEVGGGQEGRGGVGGGGGSGGLRDLVDVIVEDEDETGRADMFTLEAGGRVLSSVRTRVCGGGDGEGPGQSAEEVIREKMRAENGGELMVVREKQQPAPAACGGSYVYVARTLQGWFYVGETDDIRARIEAHRSRQALGEGAEFVCLRCDLAGDSGGAGGKSLARKIEAATIRELWYTCLLYTRMHARSHARAHADTDTHTHTQTHTHRIQGFPLLSLHDEAHRNFGGGQL